MKLSEWLTKATEDGAGGISAMRLVQVVGTLAILYVWLFASLIHVHVEEFPQSVIEVLGVLTLGKVVQAHVESQSEKQP